MNRLRCDAVSSENGWVIAEMCEPSGGGGGGGGGSGQARIDIDTDDTLIADQSA